MVTFFRFHYANKHPKLSKNFEEVFLIIFRDSFEFRSFREKTGLYTTSKYKYK